MKKLLMRRPVCIILIFAVVFAVYGAYLLINGDELTMYVNTGEQYVCEKAEVLFGDGADSTESDIFEVKSVVIRKGYAKAKIKAVKSGEEKVSFKEYSFSDGVNVQKNTSVNIVKAGKLNIIYNNLYQHFYIVLSALSLLLLAYYVFCFVNAVKTRRFSYDTVFFLSAALFFAMLLFIWGGASVYSFTQYHTTASQIAVS